MSLKSKIAFHFCKNNSDGYVVFNIFLILAVIVMIGIEFLNAAFFKYEIGIFVAVVVASTFFSMVNCLKFDINNALTKASIEKQLRMEKQALFLSYAFIAFILLSAGLTDNFSRTFSLLSNIGSLILIPFWLPILLYPKFSIISLNAIHDNFYSKLLVMTEKKEIKSYLAQVNNMGRELNDFEFNELNDYLKLCSSELLNLNRAQKIKYDKISIKKINAA